MRVAFLVVTFAAICQAACFDPIAPPDGGPASVGDAGASSLADAGHHPDEDPPLPEVDAGAPQEVEAGEEVTLRGTSSPTGERILWIQTRGPMVTLVGEDTTEASFTAPSPEDDLLLVFRLQQLDDEGEVVTEDETWVLVRADEQDEVPNQAPTADAGEDQSVDEGAEVTLAGSASDPDGEIAAVAWVQTVGPAVPVTGEDTLTPTFVAPSTSAPLALGFRLEVRDDDGGLAVDDVTITVETTNAPPVVDAGEDQSVDEGAMVTLAGAAEDSDGTIDRVVWTQVDGPFVSLADEDSAETSFPAPATAAPAVLVFVLEVEDDDGAVATDLVVITVLPVNAPPVADAGPDRTEPSGATISLAGQASDDDGVVVRTTWREVGSARLTLADPEALDTEVTLPEVDFAETVLLELEVEDDEGAVATDLMTLTVAPAADTNQPPTVSAGVDQQAAAGSAVLLTGAATDPDGSVATTTWSQISGPPVTLDDPSGLDVGFAAPDVTCAVLLVFELEAVDDEGAAATDTVSVVVDGVGAPSVPVGGSFDLDASDGGLVTEGALWAWGVPTSGPPDDGTGARVWATELGGTYPAGSLEVLCLPPLDLSGAADPTLSFSAFLRLHNGDGFLVEGLDPEAGWVPLADADPALGRVAGGRPSWSSTSPTSTWWLHAVTLPAWLGEEARLRLVFSSDGTWQDLGVYLRDLRLDDETDDPDGDGLPGVRSEQLTWGTDPFLADTDGDGAADGDEVDAGTDPLNPADRPDAPALSPGFLLDFEADAGGVVASGPTWQRGAPASGPGAAFSGTQVWATVLDGSYAPHRVAYLYLPPLDLSAATSPTLAARLWLDGHNGDGLSIEVQDPDDGAWVPLAPALPDYEATDAWGLAAWRDRRERSAYLPVAASLAGYQGERVLVRFAFRTDGSWQAPGAYLDDLTIFEESADPDDDGVPGVLAELEGGTDPFLADTDGDGSDDGDELAAGTAPDDPADFPGGPVLVPGDYLDFEGGPAGLATLGDDWQHGALASGPDPAWWGSRAYSGTQGWATNLDGDYGTSWRAALYLPPLDLTGATDPTLSFRLWLQGHHGDGLTVERWTEDGGWASLAPDVPSYDATDDTGQPAWRYQSEYQDYTWAALSLAPYAGEVVRLRLVFRTDGSWQAPGAYVDDLALEEEATDADGDGLPGLLDERLVFGTDPYLADTDGDGALDGDEVSAGTDPLDPAWFPGGPTLAPGDELDFETGPDGLASLSSGWEHGVVASGPGTATSGSQVWATGLSGGYGPHWRETLHLPPIDLSGAGAATLRFRLWLDGHNGDGLSVERWTGNGWATLMPDAPAYDATDAIGRPAWREQTAAGDYVDVTFSLADYAGEQLRLRLAFRSDGSWNSAGAYLDDLAVDP